MFLTRGLFPCRPAIPSGARQNIGVISSYPHNLRNSSQRTMHLMRGSRISISGYRSAYVDIHVEPCTWLWGTPPRPKLCPSYMYAMISIVPFCWHLLLIASEAVYPSFRTKRVFCKYDDEILYGLQCSTERSNKKLVAPPAEG